MTNEELIAEIEALDQAATPGPWEAHDCFINSPAYRHHIGALQVGYGDGGNDAPPSDEAHNNATLIARYRTLAVEAARALKETEKQRDYYLNAGLSQSREIEQTLGKALGYQLWKDLPEVAPDSTEADGVCVWEHTAETLADEAARQLAELGQSRDEWRVVAATVCCDHGGICLRAAQEKAQKDTAR